MPEIWLKYGGTHIVLDIRFENLLKHFSSNLDLLVDEEIKSKLGGVEIIENTLILATEGSKSVANAIDKLLDINTSIDSSKIYIRTFPKYVESLRTNIANKNYSVEKLQLEQFDTIIKKFQKILVVSHTKYDPLFGYSGSPTALLRYFYPNRMTEAFNSRTTNLPTTGKRGPPLDIALSAFSETEAEAIELVSNSHGISAIFHNSIIKAFSGAVDFLSKISEAEEEVSCSSAIISASDEEGPHETLLTSLSSLWNSIHLVKRNGTAVLLAENIKGIGDGALLNYVEGRIELQNAIAGNIYVEGLEHLLYLHELKSQYDLGIMSTIPHHYLAQKLGLYPYAGSKEVVQRLVEKHGRTHKILVISDADTIFIRSKQ